MHDLLSSSAASTEQGKSRRSGHSQIGMEMVVPAGGVDPARDDTLRIHVSTPLWSQFSLHLGR